MGLTRILRSTRYFRWYYRLPLTFHLISGKTREWTLLMGLIDMAICVVIVVEDTTRPKWSSDKLVTVGQVYKWVWEVGCEYDESNDQRRTDKTNTGVSPSTPSPQRSPSGIHILCLLFPNQKFNSLSETTPFPLYIPTERVICITKGSWERKLLRPGLWLRYDIHGRYCDKDHNDDQDYDGGLGLSSVDNPPNPVEGSLNWSCLSAFVHSRRRLADRLKLILVLFISFISSNVPRTYSLLTTP